MKVSQTVIYDIGTCCMVTGPMGWPGSFADTDTRWKRPYICMEGRDWGAGGTSSHNSFAGVSFTRLRLMEMSLC